MKKIFINLVSVDDVNISRRDIFVEDGFITKEFEKDEETCLLYTSDAADDCCRV